jgi:hypothetical protein
MSSTRSLAGNTAIVSPCRVRVAGRHIRPSLFREFNKTGALIVRMGFCERASLLDTELPPPKARSDLVSETEASKKECMNAACHAAMRSVKTDSYMGWPYVCVLISCVKTESVPAKNSAKRIQRQKLPIRARDGFREVSLRGARHLAEKAPHHLC